MFAKVVLFFSDMRKKLVERLLRCVKDVFNWHFEWGNLLCDIFIKAAIGNINADTIFLPVFCVRILVKNHNGNYFFVFVSIEFHLFFSVPFMPSRSTALLGTR